MTDEVGYEQPGSYCIGSDIWPGMAKLVEEMGELNQVIGKIMSGGGDPIYWDGTNLVEKLVEELADVQAVLWFFTNINVKQLKIDGEFWGPLAHRMRYKQDKFIEWHYKQKRG
jgi:hypothetical protein